MKNIRIMMGLAVGIATLFIISNITPMTIGFISRDSEDNELEMMLDNLRFVCTTARGFDETRYKHYKEMLLKQCSDKDLNDFEVVENVEPTVYEQQAMITTSGDLLDSPWPMKCHDVHHTSQSPYSTADNPYIEKWRFETCGWVEDTPIIDSDGIIYFGGCYGGLPEYLFAIYPNGTLKWRYQTGGLILGSSPAIAEDGTIYIGSWYPYLYAINPNGTLKWMVSSGGSIFSSPAIAEDGTIYFGTMSGGNSIVAVNPNGSKKWSYKTGDSITSDPAIGDDGTVYIGSCDNYLYALWPNGTLRWRFGTGDMIMGPPSIADDGTVYIGSWDGYLYAIYPNNGTMKWRRSIGSGTAVNPSIAKDGTIYTESDNLLYAFYPNGTRKWFFDLGPQRHIMGSSPAISADGTIYLGTNIGEIGGGEIIAVNPDGTEKWRKLIGYYWVDSSPSIAEDGTVYIGSADTIASGYLHAFDSIETNDPPDAPSISGPTNGRAGEEYKYSFKAIDPDRNPIRFYIDWGDGITPGWTREYASAERAKIYHTFENQGSYNISVKAKDVMGEESDWSYLDVTMPKNKMLHHSLLLRLLERFPNVLPIIRYLLGL